jgi:crossover junction endodeoxyribonuclease RusA
VLTLNDILFDVYGTPAPQGSKQGFIRGGRVVLVEGSSASGRERHTTWRELVWAEARAVRQRVGEFTGPVAVELSFRFASIKSDPYRYLHQTKPDVDKLARAVLDSLTTSRLIRDDAVIWSLTATKTYVDLGDWIGVHIRIIDETEHDITSRARRKAEYDTL